MGDSGYNSLTGSVEGDNENLNNQTPKVCAGKQEEANPPATNHKLKRFENRVDETILNRSKDIIERLNGPLVEKIYGKRAAHGSIAMRLIMLGQDESDAKPYIVIFCAEKFHRKVKKFLGAEFAKSIYRPNDQSQVSFEFIIEKPLRFTASEDTVDVRFLASHDMCLADGIIIKVKQDAHNYFATMGCLLKTTNQDDSTAILGLTVAHVVNQVRILSHENEDGECDSDTDIDSGTESLSDDSSAADGFLATNSFNLQPDPPLEKAVYTVGTLQRQQPWLPLGSIELGTRPESLARDWALVNIVQEFWDHEERLSQKTNYLRRWDLVPAPSESYKSGPKVTILRPKDWLSGNISRFPAVVQLPGSKASVGVYTIYSLSDGLSPGLSGALVLSIQSSPEKREVFGHVIADDVYGDIYVVPILDTLKDVKNALKAKDVTLSSGLDVRFVWNGKQKYEWRRNEIDRRAREDNEMMQDNWIIPDEWKVEMGGMIAVDKVTKEEKAVTDEETLQDEWDIPDEWMIPSKEAVSSFEQSQLDLSKKAENHCAVCNANRKAPHSL